MTECESYAIVVKQMVIKENHMTDFEWEVIEDIYTWADATSFDIEADRKQMIDAYWKDYFGA